jgi:hypothetical protein
VAGKRSEGSSQMMVVWAAVVLLIVATLYAALITFAKKR